MTSAQDNDDVGSTIDPTSAMPDFQTVISCYLQNIST